MNFQKIPPVEAEIQPKNTFFQVKYSQLFTDRHQIYTFIENALEVRGMTCQKNPSNGLRDKLNRYFFFT
jgi:hypothetical protein